MWILNPRWGGGWHIPTERGQSPFSCVHWGACQPIPASDLFSPTSTASCPATSPAGHTTQASPHHPCAWSVRVPGRGGGTPRGTGEEGQAFFRPRPQGLWVLWFQRCVGLLKESPHPPEPHPLTTMIYLIIGFKPTHFLFF